MGHEFECPPKREEQTWEEYAKQLAQEVIQLRREPKELKQRITELTDKMQLVINYRLNGGIDETVIVLGLQYDAPLSPKLSIGPMSEVDLAKFKEEWLKHNIA